MQAVIEQVGHDHQLLRERIARLGGPKAMARLEAGLAAARAAIIAEAAAAESTRAEAARSGSRAGLPTQSPAPVGDSGTGVQQQRQAAETTAAATPFQQSGNDRMVWELLYDLKWQLPTSELELAWTDALGETNVMQASHLMCALQALAW